MKFKKSLAVLLALVVILTSLPIITASAAAANSTLDTAIVINPTSSGVRDTHYFSNVRYDENDLWFKVVLPKNGLLNFQCSKMADVSGDIDSIDFELYNSLDTSKYIWYDDSYYYENSYGDYKFNIPLKAGTYYFRLNTNLYDESRELKYIFKFTASNDYEK